MGISPLVSVALMNNLPGEPAWYIVAITGILLVFGVLVLLFLSLIHI